MITFRTILYFLLLVTSALALLVRPYLLAQIRFHNLDPLWILSGPIMFGIFFLIYIIDEVRKSRSLQQKSRLPLASLVSGLVLLVFLLPSSFREYQARQAPSITTAAFLNDLLHSQDARIRALVMMAATCNADATDEWPYILETGLSDSDPMVQEAAKYVLEQRLGIEFPNGEKGTEGAKNTLKDWNNSFFAAKKSSK